MLDFEPTANRAKWVGFNPSSGSTGKPKLQIFRNRTLRQACLPPLSGIVDVLGVRQTVSFLGQMVFQPRIVAQFNYNLFIVLCCLHLQSRVPNSFYIMPLDTPERWAPLIAKYKCSSCLFYVPQLLRFIETDSFKEHNVSCLKVIQAGGGQLTPDMHDTVRKAFHKYSYTNQVWPVVKQVYG